MNCTYSSGPGNPEFAASPIDVFAEVKSRKVNST